MDTRTRIVSAAASLLADGGRDAVTTRAVATAASVQAPTIYRLFGDKSGLLDAVAEHGFANYLASKHVGAPGTDPVDDLRTGWDLHVQFGLENPGLHSLMYGDPRPGVRSPAAAAAFAVLSEHIHRVAVTGRLRVSEERAAQLVHAAGSGTVFALLELQPEDRDPGLSAAAREAIIAAITSESAVVSAPGPAAAAIALRAALPEAASLSDGERVLLGEWLDRLA